MIKKNKGYVEKKINGTMVLIPRGQLIADHTRYIELNKAAERIFDLVDGESEREDIIKKIMDGYGEAAPCTAGEDTVNFLNELIDIGVLEESSQKSKHPAKILKIAGILVRLYGNNKAFSDEFDNFLADETDHESKESILDIIVKEGKSPVYNEKKCLLKNDLLEVWKIFEGYLVCFPDSYGINGLVIYHDGERAVFYTGNVYDDGLRYDLFHGIRIPFLFLAERFGAYAIHSASILYGDKAYLFSASSGTGKSTHAAIWKRLFGVSYINGDLNLVSISDGSPVVYGMPWCGTSRICDNKEHILGGLIFLKRGNVNEFIKISDKEKILRAGQRVISPLWERDMVDGLYDVLGEMIPGVFCGILRCNMDDGAGIICKNEVDKYVIKNDKSILR